MGKMKEMQKTSLTAAIKAANSAIDSILYWMPIVIADETTLRYARLHVQEAKIQMQYMDLALENK